MHLRRIELTNYRQHRKLDVDFSGNLIAVLGPNGCGKSNLIGAIQFALTGEQPGFTKADLTTWGEKEGSVRLIFGAGPKNEEFVITRKTNGDVVLKVGDETVKQAKKVEEALREKAGLDKELIRQIVFVPQKGIDAILFDDPKNREVAFQRLIGIGNASKIYEALRTEIAAYDKPQGFDEAIARSRQQLAEQEGVAKTCREALGRYENAVKTLPSKESLEAEVDQCAGAQQAIAAYVRAEQALSDTQAQHESALAKLSGMGAVSEDEEQKLRNESAELSKDLESCRERLDAGKEAVRFLTRMKELSDAAVKAKADLAEADKAMDELNKRYSNSIDDEREHVAKLEAAQTALEAEGKSLRNMMKEASSDGTCPLCGGDATQEDIEKHVGDRLKAIDDQLAEAVDKAVSARNALTKRSGEEYDAKRRVDVAKDRYDSAFLAIKKAHDANVEGCEINLETFDVSFKGETPDALPEIEKKNNFLAKRMTEIDNRASEISRSLNAIDATKRQAKDARDNVAKLAAQIDLIEKNRRDCAEKLAGLGIDPESVKNGDEGSCDNALKKARANLDAYNGILRDMAGTKGQLEAAEKTIAGTKELIDDLERKKELEDKVKVKVDTLKRSRDWFHYREGPRIMSQNVMKELTACVNSYLDQFCAPFVVDAEEEGFGFRCRFIDGRTMPDPHPDASLLSGGQKVALAIAFRMAIYMCFGGELGLLSLDEPTAYLDDASIEHLGELLQKVGEVAKSRGLQILMATHEKAIMPFLDTKIDLGAIINKEV